MTIILSTPGCHLDDLSNAMNYLLLGNQVASLLDEPQKCIDILRPLIQNLVGVLGFRKRDNTGRTIDLGIDRLRHHELGQEFLAILGGQIQKLCQTLSCNASVVLGNDTNVLNRVGGER